MSRKREVTIGVTINLENYENLRLEVEGDVETHEDVDDLISFLDGMLARLGRGDPATADRVDAYRRRVLSLQAAGSEMGVAVSVTADDIEAEMSEVSGAIPVPMKDEGAGVEAADTDTVVVSQATSSIEPLQTSELREEVNETIPEELDPAPEEPTPVGSKPQYGQAKPEPSVTTTAEEDVCEMCGTGVTKSQAKLSQLFMSKTLCKRCMEKP